MSDESKPSSTIQRGVMPKIKSHEDYEECRDFVWELREIHRRTPSRYAAQALESFSQAVGRWEDEQGYARLHRAPVDPSHCAVNPF